MNKPPVSIIGGSDGPRDPKEPNDSVFGVLAFVWFLLVLAALFVLACGTRTLDDVAPVGDHGELVISDGGIQTVDYSDRCDTVDCPPFRRWRRAGDTIGEVRWLVSTQYAACLVNDAQFALAASWQYRKVRCAWRPMRLAP